LVERYLAVSGELGREGRLPEGPWGRVAVFLEAAWTPGLPDRSGPEELGPAADFLFDWRELPDGVGSPQGRFRARVLEVSELWADAGIALTGGYERVALTVSLPLWASEAAFADEPFRGQEKKPFALRWAITLKVFPEWGEEPR
jgi:hypothetical protein